MPSGFSFDDSLITVRPSSVVERPGVYGAIPRIQGLGEGAGVMFVMAAGHSGRGAAVANACVSRWRKVGVALPFFSRVILTKVRTQSHECRRL